MQSKTDFVDYYDLMQISPRAEPETIKRVYKLLVSRLHPDNSATGDAESFILLRRAFETLSDPGRRAAYDHEHAVKTATPIDAASMAKGVDAELGRRIAILSLLYRQRMTNPERQGLSLLELQQMTRFPQEKVSFTTWYLQSKDYIGSADNSDLVITTAGIDYVEANLPPDQTGASAGELLETKER
jgi:curved DNA-binding protein